MICLYLAQKKADISGMPFALEDIMAPERLQKISRMKNKNAAALSLTAGLLLHRACQDAGIEGAERKIGYTKRGRPYFSEYPQFYFSISHSGDFACLTFGTENNGVDIEEIRPVRETVVNRVFTQKEREWLFKSQTPDSPYSCEENIIRLWTRKESCGKYLGEGLSEQVLQMTLSPEDDGQKAGVCETPEGKKMRFLEYRIPGYRLTVCLAGRQTPEEEEAVNILPGSNTVKINIEL